MHRPSWVIRPAGSARESRRRPTRGGAASHRPRRGVSPVTGVASWPADVVVSRRKSRAGGPEIPTEQVDALVIFGATGDLAKLATGADRDRAGRIVVQKDLTIPGHPEIFVIGDLMSLNKLPGVAEVAMQSGLYAGRRIRREAKGHGYDKPFRYHDLGSAAYIARGNALMSAGPVKLSGFPGWVGWLFIHIAFLTGYRNRLGAILTWWTAFTRDRRRERAFTTREVGQVADLYGAVIPAARSGDSAQAPDRAQA